MFSSMIPPPATAFLSKICWMRHHNRRAGACFRLTACVLMVETAALWKQMCPDGKEPDLDTFLDFMADRLDMMMGEQMPKKSNKHFLS